MPQVHGMPGEHVGFLPRYIEHVSLFLFATVVLLAEAATSSLLQKTTSPEPSAGHAEPLSTSTTKWGTTKTTVTAPGTLDLDETADLARSQQPLPTKPWTPKFHAGDCSEQFALPPVPAHATDLNGVALPDTCIMGQAPHHVFVIGDWGGVFNGADKPIAPADRRSKHMSHYRPFVVGADDCAQQNVARQMNARSLVSKPDYILNVGDNFYWGGVLVKCGGPPHTVGDPVGQWTWVFEKIYDGPALADKPWLGVLGNHDFGGFLFTHGWDQAIGYTWAETATSTGRWVTPALYWKSKVRYHEFSVDYYFVDSNVFDAVEPENDPGHNLCSRKHNLPVGATCGIQGPVSIEECPSWFRRLWDAEVQWLRHALAESTADWQIVVTHFPPIRGWGDDVWHSFAHEFGLDLIISGHVHKQEVHYSGVSNHKASVPYIISGGGGGITSENMPRKDGQDDQYGFMDLTLTAKEVMIEAISHGGHLRNRTCIRQRQKGGTGPDNFRGPSLCDEVAKAVPSEPTAAPEAAHGKGARPTTPPSGSWVPATSGPALVLQDGLAAQLPGGYTFVGFTGPAEARLACNAGRHLATPRDSAQWQGLLEAMGAALREGYMSESWPENTIWLGGFWSASHRLWQWDDGAAILEFDWAARKPSPGSDQERQEWLCMSLDGKVRVAGLLDSFATFCEETADANVSSIPSADVGITGALGVLDDVAAAIASKSWDTVQVHTPLPGVQKNALVAGFAEHGIGEKDVRSALLVGPKTPNRWPFSAEGALVIAGATSIAALAALVLFMAGRRQLFCQAAIPYFHRCSAAGTGEVLRNGSASRLPVPYAQL